MKKITVIFLLFTLIQVVNAQDDGNREEGSRTVLRDNKTAYLRNTTVVIDNQTFDYRVLKYYSVDALNTMDPVKRNQIYYIYNKSYTVLDLNTCNNMLLIDIDISRLEIYRLDNQRVVVEYGTDCKVHVELLSRNELKEQLDLLKK